MATIHFTGTSYSGHDGATPVRLVAPGDYEVSEAKAQQLAADFPQEFTQVETQAAKDPSSDPAPKERTCVCDRARIG